jgi:hypothetical protein
MAKESWRGEEVDPQPGREVDPQPEPRSVGTSFDDLARGLASGSLSRRKALRFMGGALVGSLLAAIPGVAWAQQTPGTPPPGRGCPEGLTRCPGASTRRSCFDLQRDPGNCGQCGNVCSQDEICCQGQCVPCPGGQFNFSTCECCQAGEFACGGQCVPCPGGAGQFNPDTCECCPPGSVPCGCCGREQACVPCPEGQQINFDTCFCCPPGAVPCQGGCVSCPEGQQLNPNICFCCPPGQEPCDGSCCCPPGEVDCFGQCCPEGQCCGPGQCCPEGQQCDFSTEQCVVLG